MLLCFKFRLSKILHDETGKVCEIMWETHNWQLDHSIMY